MSVLSVVEFCTGAVAYISISGSPLTVEVGLNPFSQGSVFDPSGMSRLRVGSHRCDCL